MRILASLCSILGSIYKEDKSFYFDDLEIGGVRTNDSTEVEESWFRRWTETGIRTSAL